MLTPFARTRSVVVALVAASAIQAHAQGMPGGMGGGPPGGAGPGGAGRPGAPSRSETAPMTYDPKSVETLCGRVTALGALDPGGPRLSTLGLQTPGAQFTVVLGPAREGAGAVLPAPFSVGDSIAVKGVRSQFRGEPVFLAAEITAKGQTLRLRDPATGAPVVGGPGGGGPSDRPGIPPGVGPPSGASGEPQAQERLYMRVRGVWRIPEEEAQALLRESPQRPPLEEFSAMAMARRYSGRTLQEVRALRAAQESWAGVAREIGGPLEDLLFRGDARHPRVMADGTLGQSPAPPSDEEVVELAQVMTLERLTGLNPAAIRRDLNAGRAFESLLESVAQQSSPSRPQEGKPGPAGGSPGGAGGSGGPPR